MKNRSIVTALCIAVLAFSSCSDQADSSSGTASSVAETATATVTTSSARITTVSSEAATTSEAADPPKEEDPPAEEKPDMNTGRANTADYTLKEVVVLSRHSIRAPLSSNGSLNETATPHEWFSWTSNSSELSLRGGVLETEMGQYFRKWLESEELIPENWHPAEGEARFYANSKQRTLATTHYFAGGFLPSANVEVENHAEFEKQDETFKAKIHYYSDSYAEAVARQFEEYGGKDIAADIQANVDLLCDVIDYTESPGYKSGELKDLDMTETTLSIEQGEEPIVGGSLKTAFTVSDALVLQYYEEPDARKAAFGKELTEEQWSQIADITAKFTFVRHTLPLIAINTANPIIKEIKSELTNPDRKFTFLCGHDCTVAGVLSAMEAEDYELPYSLDKKTPIGVKLVFEKWADKDGKEFAALELIYQSTDQLRSTTMLDLDTPPAIYGLSFKGLEKNSDGLYEYSDIIGRLDKAIEAYDELAVKYPQELENAA